jgi:hypothetical protein
MTEALSEHSRSNQDSSDTKIDKETWLLERSRSCSEPRAGGERRKEERGGGQYLCSDLCAAQPDPAAKYRTVG